MRPPSVICLTPRGNTADRVVGAQNHARIIYGYGTVGDKETLLGKILILAPGLFGARNKLPVMQERRRREGRASCG